MLQTKYFLKIIFILTTEILHDIIKIPKTIYLI